MTTRTEANVLADAYESVRALTRWYLSKMKEVDMFKEFEVDDKKLNSAYWVMAHLVWAENFLLLRALGGKPVDLPWLDQFGISSTPVKRDTLPEVKHVLDEWKAVHVTAMTHVRSLPDDLLATDNPAGFGFAGDNSYRMMIQHAIRHEAMHTGHLSWLCKLYGIKTV